MSKVFGYPEYDEKGEKILTTYDNEYKAMMMDIRVYRMKAGETRTFLREGEETAVLLLSGNITYKWNGNEATATRKDVFTEGPTTEETGPDICHTDIHSRRHTSSNSIIRKDSEQAL